MDVASVMDDHAESERSGIGINGEVFVDLNPVVGVEVFFTGALEPLGQVGEGTNDIVIGHFVIGVVVEGVTVDSVSLVDEVPSGLETVVRLNIVSESSALREGVVDLAGDQVGLRDLKGVQLSESGF
jgi:hypothetical protein